jgi:thiol-disulfide isomerase/thioredoxin
MATPECHRGHARIPGMRTAASPRTAALLLGLVTLAVAVSACGGSVERPDAEATAAPRTAPGIDSGQATDPPAGSGVADRAWATSELVDVATGETFRIADYAGRVVIVETMAIWCSSCRVQQDSVETALRRIPANRVAYVLLDVDPNEDAESLAAYRAQRGYTGRYAIAPREVAVALAEDFSDQFLSPPSTPIAIVATDGTVTRTDFGQKSPDEIVALVTAAGA